MSRNGIVIEVKGEYAAISTSRRGICGDCADRSSCSFESAMGSDAPEIVQAGNPVGASPGDLVEFDLPGFTELKLSILIWAVPIIGLIAGAIIGSRIHGFFSLSNDLSTLIGAVFGFFLFFAPIVIYDRMVASDPKLNPSIIRVIPSPCPTGEASDEQQDS